MSDKQKKDKKADFLEDIYDGDIPDRNYYANIVSKLYYVIAMKPEDDTETGANVETKQEGGNETDQKSPARVRFTKPRKADRGVGFIVFSKFYLNRIY